MPHKKIATILVLALFAILAACASSRDPLPTAAPSSPSATETPAPETPAVVREPLSEVTMGELFSLPPGVTLYVTRHCHLCDRPPWDIHAMEVDQTGRLSSASVLDSLPAAIERDMPGDGERQAYFLGAWVRPDGSEALVEVCVAGSCGDKCFKTPPSDDAVINVYGSLDDGRTWSVTMTLEPPEYILGTWEDGRIIVGNCIEKTSWLIPGGDALPYSSDSPEGFLTIGRATRFPDGSLVYPPEPGYLLRELPEGTPVEWFKLPGEITSISFGPYLSDREQLLTVNGRPYVINWHDYQLHPLDSPIDNPGILRIAGIRHPHHAK